MEFIELNSSYGSVNQACDTERNTLIVEDDADIRETFQVALDLEGYHVFTAANGREALEQLRTMPLKPCVIFLDLMMPVMNGNEFLSVVEKDPELAKIPVVVVSAFTSRLSSAHARGTLSKPINLNQLLNITHQFCRKEHG
ncbi:MAG: response regulator [Pseudobdellovibrio sp.]|nr:response regulator [Pseudobdellovibrio sp.]